MNSFQVTGRHASLSAAGILILAAQIAACSSGADSVGTTPPPAPPSGGNDDPPAAVESLTGVFLDAAVGGLEYSTPSLGSDTTDEQGTFHYAEGETVTFSLLGQTLADVRGADVLTPMDLQGADAHPDLALNLARFLMSIDADQDPSFGITVPDVDGTLNVEFGQSLDDFTDDEDVAAFLSDNLPGRTLVSPEAAAEHFSGTLAEAHLQTDYSVNLLLQAEAFSVVRSSDCPGPAAVGGWHYTFQSNGMQLVGSDTFAQCQRGEDETIFVGYDEIDDIPFSCASALCTYADLNRTIAGVDGEDRPFISTYSHTPGSNLFTYIKRVTGGADAGTVFSEHIVMGAYEIDLRGKTATSVVTSPQCHGAEGGFTYTFSDDAMTVSGTDTWITDSSGNCTVGGEPEVTTVPYDQVDGEDGPFDCEDLPVCRLEELNQVITVDADEDGQPVEYAYWHIPGSKEFTNRMLITGGIGEGQSWMEVVTLNE